VSSKSFREALKNIADEKTLEKIAIDLERALDPDFVEPAVDLDEFPVELPQLGDPAPSAYHQKSSDMLWSEMGFPGESRVLGMAYKQHITKKYSEWDEDTEAIMFWRTENHPHKQDIIIPWHQSVGIHMGATQMLKNEPFFLFDAVGIGKTPQAAGILLMRPFLMDYYEKHGKYPAWRKYPVYIYCNCLFANSHIPSSTYSKTTHRRHHSHYPSSNSSSSVAH
jgi:hypothetical protein